MEHYHPAFRLHPQTTTRFGRATLTMATLKTCWSRPCPRHCRPSHSHTLHAPHTICIATPTSKACQLQICLPHRPRPRPRLHCHHRPRQRRRPWLQHHAATTASATPHHTLSSGSSSSGGSRKKKKKKKKDRGLDLVLVSASAACGKECRTVGLKGPSTFVRQGRQRHFTALVAVVVLWCKGGARGGVARQRRTRCPVAILLWCGTETPLNRLMTATAQI